METPRNGPGNGLMGRSGSIDWNISYFNISSHINWKAISSDDQKKLQLTKDSDGEFYMSFNRDFLRYFGELELVHLTPGRMAEEDSSKKWDVFPFRGMWKGETAGGCGNDAISKNRYSAGIFYCFLQAVLPATPNCSSP